MEKRIKAKIKEAKLEKILKLWRGKKPRGMGFEITDAIALTAEPEEGKHVKATFYLRAKADGSFTKLVLGRDLKKCHERLAKFLQYYKFTKDAEGYNIKEEIGKWAGKEIEIVTFDGSAYVCVP